MEVTITDLPEGMTMQDLATRLYQQYGRAAEAEPVEPKSDRTQWTARLAEIIDDLSGYDYWRAESKSRILLEQMRKGDWTLGAGVETEQKDDGFVRMNCDSADESSESDATVDVLITAWGAHPDEDATEDRTCAFCGRDDPCVICGGDWFCDGRCADNHQRDDVPLADFKEGLIDGLRNCRAAFANLANDLKAHQKDEIIKKQRNTIEDLESKILMIPDNFWSVVRKRDAIIKELKDQNINDLKELYDIHAEDLFAVKAVRKTAFALSQEIINDLESRLTEKQTIIDRITLLRSNEIETLYAIEAELSARKEDSAVLMKVVEIVKRDDNCPTIINQLGDLLGDYLDAPEGLR